MGESGVRREFRRTPADAVISVDFEGNPFAHHVPKTLYDRATAEYLVPPECRDGGSLDLKPGSTRFP